jgi:ketosteroid isomerase-like protein
MSQGNIALVRRLYAEEFTGFRGASPDDDLALLGRLFRDYCDEQFEMRLPAEYPEGEQVFRGREGFARLLAMLRDAWTEFRFEPERFIDAGDRVVVLIRLVAEGGASGVTTELKTAHVWTGRHGRMSSIQIYRDRAEALEAVGLRE